VERMRDIVRGNLGRSLRALSEEDRIAAAWTIACGRALSERSSILEFRNGVMRVGVADAAWLRQFSAMRSQLILDAAQIAEVAIQDIHFELMPAIKTDEEAR
jgi:hypothetical protein